MIKIVNIETGAIVASYDQHVIREFDRSSHRGLHVETVRELETRFNEKQAKHSEHNRRMETSARDVCVELNASFITHTIGEPLVGYVMVFTGPDDIYGVQCSCSCEG